LADQGNDDYVDLRKSQKAFDDALIALEKNRPLASAGRCAAETNAAPGTSRTLAWNRSSRRLVQVCWRIHRTPRRWRCATEFSTCGCFSQLCTTNSSQSARSTSFEN